MIKWFEPYKKTVVKALIVSIIALAFVFLLYGIINGSIIDFFNEFFKVTAPITVGFVIAYLSNSLVSFFENKVFKWIKKFSLRRLISILTTFALAIAIIVMILTLVIPSLISTLKGFWEAYVVSYEESIVSIANSINAFLDRIKMDKINPEALLNWINANLPWIADVSKGDFSTVLPNNQSIFLPIFNIAFDVGTSLFTVVKNIVLGLFIAGYMLMAKEKVKASLRRLLNSFLSPKKVRAVVRFGKLVDRTFGGFIEGQLIDAGIVGVICYVVFSIFKIPVPLLLSCIIAVTNVIPIFGPFIGGIPAAFLVLLTEPSKLILFIVLIFVIQQIDGNIICPHILGDKINISSLATIIAIITMGGLFGIFGMVIGVPVFAVIIHMINSYTMNSLRRKGLETSLVHYYVGDTKKITDKKIKGIQKRIKDNLLKRKNKKEK